MTFKEFMHTPNSHLDDLAREAEAQRTADEEAIYDKRISNEDKYYNFIVKLKLSASLIEAYEDSPFENERAVAEMELNEVIDQLIKFRL